MTRLGHSLIRNRMNGPCLGFLVQDWVPKIKEYGRPTVVSSQFKESSTRRGRRRVFRGKEEVERLRKSKKCLSQIRSGGNRLKET